MKVEKEYVTGKMLGEVLSISYKTVMNKSFQIVGRTKIGGSVRYHLPTILEALKSGENIFSGGDK